MWPHQRFAYDCLLTHEISMFTDTMPMARPFLRDLFVPDHRSMVLKVWGAQERVDVTGISHGTLIFICMINIM